MDKGPNIAQVASLVGDPARANMLAALLDGKALTASELAYVAGVPPQTASGHLAKLSDAKLLALEKQGRHRYFRLASALVGQMLEGLMAVAETGPARHRPHWQGGDALRGARTCYDHLAGRLAVSIADTLIARGHVILDGDGGNVTEAGRTFLESAGIDLATASKRRVFCRPCLDWSERRPHLAGALGAAICRHTLAQGWLIPISDSRALEITAKGRQSLFETFGIGR
jgi:DNA-binding transcriptional ArsR family regulator